MDMKKVARAVKICAKPKNSDKKPKFSSDRRFRAAKKSVAKKRVAKKRGIKIQNLIRYSDSY